MSTALVTTAAPPLATSNGGLIAGKLNVRIGKVELTAGELTVRVMSRFYMMFGLIGMLLGRKSKGTVALAVDLARITAVARGKYGVNKKILDVTVDGGAVHRIMVDDFDRFAAALRDQLAARGTASWQVAA